MVVAWLAESDVVLSVDNEIAGVDVVSLKDLFEDFGLVHSALFHEVNDFILYDDCMVNVVVKLNLHFVLKLSCLVHEVLILNWVSKVFVVLSQEVEFANVSPRVESVSHWVLCIEPNVFTSSQ